MATQAPPSSADAPAFVYVGGDPSLDLVNTVDWAAGGLTAERLGDYQRFTRWAEGAGVIPRAEGRRLRRAAHSQPREARVAVADAGELRSILQRVFRAVAEREAAPDGAWEEFNRRLGDALARLRLAPAGPGAGRGGARWRWLDAETRLDSPLWPVVWSAARLLASDEAGRIRVCAGPDCGWMYVDRSRNRMRRWCEMRTCGTAAKTRRRRQRRSAARAR